MEEFRSDGDTQIYARNPSLYAYWNASHINILCCIHLNTISFLASSCDGCYIVLRLGRLAYLHSVHIFGSTFIALIYCDCGISLFCAELFSEYGYTLHIHVFIFLQKYTRANVIRRWRLKSSIQFCNEGNQILFD